MSVPAAYHCNYSNGGGDDYADAGRQADNTATPVIKLDLCKQYVN